MSSEAVFALRADVRDEYALGPTVLLRVDSRLTSSGYVHAYAPITVDGTPIRSDQFWDDFGDVVELDAGGL